jgi:hypothetical protein
MVVVMLLPLLYCAGTSGHLAMVCWETTAGLATAAHLLSCLMV